MIHGFKKSIKSFDWHYSIKRRLDMIESKEFAELFVKGKMEEVKSLVRKAIQKGEDVEALLNQGLIKAMEEVGVKFSNFEIFLPEMLVSAKCMQACLEILKPILIGTSSYSKREKIVLGTVEGDLHDIGKNLLGMMLEGAGYEVVDIGINAPPEKFFQATKKHNAKIVAMSAMLTTTRPEVKVTIDRLKAEGQLGNVKIIVGGACISQKHAEESGADAYAMDAAAAVIKVRELLEST